MSKDVRDFVESLGGYRAVASRMGCSAKTTHGYIAKGKLPSNRYVAFCQLAAEKQLPPPQFCLFDFKILSDAA